ncbi:MAG: peptidase T [Rikenellaceae bacterium]|nr:peptidase T [Rikenellaceae bacterium]
MESVESRFLRYVKIDTQSDPTSQTVPSTDTQQRFLRMIAEEMTEIGVSGVTVDENGYVMGRIPANTDRIVPAIGFIAHVDTSPDTCGKGVNPQIKKYNGGDISLNQNIIMSPSEFPELDKYIGHTLITTDGTTLLGADDKAGVAEILTAAGYIIHSGIEHGDIIIGFTPDEEIGRGADHFDVEKFGAEFAYTVDGGPEGELEYENFNAAGVRIEINGVNIHPGYAKGKMINALRISPEFNSMIPESDCPEFTEGYEGFLHLVKISGAVDHAVMEYIIRDHDRTKFEEKKLLIKQIVSVLNEKYGDGTVSCAVTDQYYNMREVIERSPEIIELASRAMKNCGVRPDIKPIRGGTDGARLSFMGLPCPNLFAGGENFHGKYEFISIETMHKAVDVIIEIIKLTASDC